MIKILGFVDIGVIEHLIPDGYDWDLIPLFITDGAVIENFFDWHIDPTTYGVVLPDPSILPFAWNVSDIILLYYTITQVPSRVITVLSDTGPAFNAFTPVVI